MQKPFRVVVGAEDGVEWKSAWNDGKGKEWKRQYVVL